MRRSRESPDRGDEVQRSRTTTPGAASLAVLFAALGGGVTVASAERPVPLLWQRLVSARRRAAPADEQRRSALYSASPSGIAELDLDLTILAANAAFLRLVDRPEAEVLGRYGPELLHPDGPAATPEVLAELGTGERASFTSHHVVLRADGVRVPVRLDWGVVDQQEDQPRRLVCVATDMTEQAALRTELERARERAEVLWRQAPIGVVEGTLDGRVLSTNAAFAQLLGYSPEELVGIDARTLAAPELAQDIAERTQQLLRGESYLVERRYLPKDGPPVPVLTSATVLRDASGAVDRFAAFVVDLSELHAQRQALQAALEEVARQRAFMEAVLETVDVGIRYVDADGTNLRRNSAERAMSKVPKEYDGGVPQVAGRMTDLLDSTGAPIDPDDLPLVRVMRGEDPEPFTGKLGPKGGPHRDVVVNAKRVTGLDGEVLGAVVSLTDITAERSALRALAAERAALAEAQRVGRIGSFSVDPVTGQWTMSDQLYELWGHPDARPGIDELRRQILDVDPDELAAASEEGFRAGGRFSNTFRLRHAGTGEERIMVSTTEVTLGADGRPVSITGTHHDITELTAAERTATEAKSFYEAALVATPDYTFITDLATGALLYGTPGKTLLGLDSQQLQALGAGKITALVHPDDQTRLRALNVAAGDLEDGQVLQLQYRAKHADGTWRWLARRVTPFRREPSGRVTQVLGVVRDVTDVVQAEDRLRHTALHDGLTGLPNRALLQDRLGEALLRAREACEDLAVIFVDLDGFKRINDGYGHSVGDEVLRVTAARLRAVLRKQDTVARFGGDEFVVLIEQAHRVVRDLTGCSDALPADQKLSMREYGSLVAHRLIAAVAEPIQVAGQQHRLTASAGVRIVGPGSTGCLSDHVDTAEGVLRDADTAMYEAKEAGKDRFVVSPAGPCSVPGDPGPTKIVLPS